MYVTNNPRRRNAVRPGRETGVSGRNALDRTRKPCKIGSNRILAAVHARTGPLFVCPVPAAPPFGAGQFALLLSVTAAGTLP